MASFNLLYRITCVLLLFCVVVSCSDDDPEPDPDPVTVPSLSTHAVINITLNTAQSEGSISDDGGADVTERGVVWGISQNPTLQNNDGYTSDGSGTGVFESLMEGLSPKTIYHVRAYATNSEGTSYGDNHEFETDVAMYSLVLESEPDDAGSVSGGGFHEEGAVVEIVAEPAGEWTFNGWSGDTEFVDNPEAATTNVPMPGQNIMLTANFAPQDDAVYGDGVTDIDGNEYVTVIIGEQEWMAHNLRTTKYANGSDIPTDLHNDDWGSTWEGAYAVYDHEAENTARIDSPEEMTEIYGLLYNFRAVNTDKLCPGGWEVPASEDWEELADFLMTEYDYPNNIDDPQSLGQPLKVARMHMHPWGGDYNTHDHPRWESNTTYYGIDRFGFSALPGGYRSRSGVYSGIGHYAYWWSSTETEGSPVLAVHGGLNSSNNRMQYAHSNSYKRAGLSVRCIKKD